MKKIYVLVALIVSALSFGQVTLPHYEAMNYTVGQGLQTQAGWVSVNTGDDLAVASGNLSYTGLTASTGNKISFAGAGIDALKSFTTQSSGTVYYSLLLNVSSMAGVTDANGGYIGGFQSTTANTFGASLWTKRIDDNTFNIGVEVRTATGVNTTWSAVNYTTTQTYLIVGSYTFGSGVNDDVAKLWINPALGVPEPAATLTDSHTGGDLTNVANFLLRQDSTTETPALEVDELRIGLTWADVTPFVPLSIKENTISGLKIYPSPANTNLYITSDSNESMEAIIYNVLGKVVLNTKVTNTPINVSSLTRGVYMVKVTEGSKTVTRKLLIE